MTDAQQLAGMDFIMSHMPPEALASLIRSSERYRKRDEWPRARKAAGVADRIGHDVRRLLDMLDPIGTAQAAEEADEEPEALKIATALGDESTTRREESGEPLNPFGALPFGGGYAGAGGSPLGQAGDGFAGTEPKAAPPPVGAAPEEARPGGDAKVGIRKPEATPSDPSAASVLDKLYRYTLNSEYPRGKEKAVWFEKALGYTRSNINDLAKQIVFDETKAVRSAVTQYGTKFTQIIHVVGSNGKTMPVFTVWIKGIDGITKLGTAYPDK